MKCPKCQAENPDDAEFCSLCFARFKAQLRPQEVEEAARRMREEHQGAKLRCPNCQELSPLDSQFCLRCGFVFEDLDELMISADEIERLRREQEERDAEEKRTLLGEPLVVGADQEGAEIMRSLAGSLENGLRPRIHARGRNDVTYAMKIVALLGQELREKGVDLRCRIELIAEGAVTHLDDVEVEVVLEGIKEGA